MEKRILDSLLRIFNRQFLIHINQLSERHNFSRDLGMNELERMEMLYYVENEFHINIDDREVKKISTVADLITTVQKYAQ